MTNDALIVLLILGFQNLRVVKHLLDSYRACYRYIQGSNVHKCLGCRRKVQRGVHSDTNSPICGPSGIGGTSTIVGGCEAGVTTADARIVTVSIGVLENVKGRALIGGSL